MTNFSEMINARMKKLGVKQKDLADLLGLKRQVVKYKITHDSFTRKELIELREILQLDLEEILSKIEK